jgi:prepilin-type N-terminal cleavage/methylation domain-containing protein
MSGMNFESKIRSQRGFTMTEMLGAVAILVVLFALIVPNVFRASRDLRQTELDAKA